MKIVDEIIDLFQQRGDAAYLGEAISQTEHALQSAALAEQQGAPDTLVIAALLHDIGHLLDGQDEDLADRGLDGRHEEAGYSWLTAHFGPEVTEPVRLHVTAKRYLCAVDPVYLARLSPASRLSLSLQGGPLEAAQCAEFESNPLYHDAIRLRHWDDTAKVPGLKVPGLDSYRERLQAALQLSSTDYERGSSAMDSRHSRVSSAAQAASSGVSGGSGGVLA
jgi:[1-hydroxy-2-(trimethylamino)ethyl]phosphonate dioxygenase